MEGFEASETTPDEPFLLHEASAAFLAGDPSGIRQRFEFRRDAFDYLAMAGAAAGVLLLMANLQQLLGGSRGSEELNAGISALGLAGLLIVGGVFYVVRRQRAAAARLQLIRDGRVLSGTIVACEGREETTAEVSLGETTRAYVVSVEYRFATPAGHEITDHDAHNRRDLRRAELPEAGAPVRVLYRDDQTYVLL